MIAFGYHQKLLVTFSTENARTPDSSVALYVALLGALLFYSLQIYFSPSTAVLFLGEPPLSLPPTC